MEDVVDLGREDREGRYARPGAGAFVRHAPRTQGDGETGHRLLLEQLLDRRPLFGQLLLRRRDLRLREVVVVDALHHRVLAARAGRRETEDEALGDAVAAIAGNA